MQILNITPEKKKEMVQTIKQLVDILDMKYPDSYQHSINFAFLLKNLQNKYGFEPQEMFEVFLDFCKKSKKYE